MRKPYSLLLTLLLLLLLASCRTTQYVPLPEVRTEYVHDTILRADSVYVSHYLLQRGDTIWMTDTVLKYLYRDKIVEVTRHDSIYVPVPVEPPPRKSLALSERVRVLGKGCLIGGIGAVVLLLLIRIAKAVYLHR